MAKLPRRRRPRSLAQQKQKIIVAFIGTLISYGIKFLQVLWYEPATVSWLFDRFLLIIYVGLWIFATATAVQATRILYGRSPNQSRVILLLCVILSVTTCITGFAMAYLDISASDPWNAFSTREALDPIEALYFSIVTFATVGYGDISPMSSLARIVTSAQILISMFYTILIFSVIAGFIRQGNGSVDPEGSIASSPADSHELSEPPA